jgi:hypothetical protein
MKGPSKQLILGNHFVYRNVARNYILKKLISRGTVFHVWFGGGKNAKRCFLEDRSESKKPEQLFDRRKHCEDKGFFNVIYRFSMELIFSG